MGGAAAGCWQSELGLGGGVGQGELSVGCREDIGCVGLAPGYQGIDDERGDFNAWVLAK